MRLIGTFITVADNNETIYYEETEELSFQTSTTHNDELDDQQETIDNAQIIQKLIQNETRTTNIDNFECIQLFNMHSTKRNNLDFRLYYQTRNNLTIAVIVAISVKHQFVYII